MKANTKIADIFVASKPVNFYVYSFGSIFLSLGLGFLGGYLKHGDSSPGVMTVVFAVLCVMVLSYFIRFYIARNYEPLRNQILQTESEDEALKLVMGGYVWGVFCFTACAITFYVTIEPLL